MNLRVYFEHDLLQVDNFGIQKLCTLEPSLELRGLDRGITIQGMKLKIIE